ncbi:DUF6923 family protein [Microbacterium sp. NPDC008134]|uniref:DUF7507 domain-containing protein n=1 Tax=Microbacterium sp. NPDC008134 TaxID=3364183 RepID=UPI0036F16B96
MFVAQGVPTILYKAESNGTGATTFTPVGGASGVQYNAIGYNTADNFIYGISNGVAPGFPAQSLIRVDSEGLVTRVGTATYGSSVLGEFSPTDGYLYTYTTVGGTVSLQAINVATGAIVRNTPLRGAATVGNDFAFLGGYLWSANASTISRIDPATGVVTNFANTFSSGEGAATATAGAAWTFGNGNLGFSFNETGNVYQVAIPNPGAANPTFTLISRNPGPPSGSNDGAASPGLPTDLAIVKDGPIALVPGGTATYTLTVTNNGPGNSSGFSVRDVVPAPLTNVVAVDEACTATGNTVNCVGGPLLNGDSVSFTVTASIPADIDAVVENTASVIPNENDPTPENNTSTSSSAPAGLSIEKNAGEPVDVNGNGLVDAGDTIRFTFVVENTGQVELTGIAVSDPKVGDVLCPVSTLAPGASQTCEAANTYVITADDVTAGSVDNTATATATTPDGESFTSTPSSTSTPTTAPAPSLTVVKSANPSEAAEFEAGQEIVYSFVVTNTGNVPLNDIEVEDTDFTGTGTLSPVDCPVATLPTGEQTVCTATYTLTQDDVDAGSVTNSAVAGGTPPGDDTPMTSDPSTVTIPSIAAPGLTVEKTASTESLITAGQEITYSFRLENTGNVTLADLTVNETEFSGTGELGDVVCPSESLVPGQFIICTATYTATQEDVDAGGELSNTATAGGTTPGGDPTTSDPSTSDVPVIQAPALTVQKTADVVAAEVGQTVTYSFLVSNVGNVTITDPTVNEVEFSGTGELSEIVCPAETTLAPSADITCTATYVVTQADIDSGELSNTATVTGTTPGGEPTDPSEPSTETVTTDPLPALSVVKTADVEQVTSVGQIVTYSFVVTNVGNVTISDVAVDEGEFTGNGTLSEVVCPSEEPLAPGESFTCSATYEVVAADLAAGGRLSNTATGTGTTPGGGTITSPPSTATVEQIAPPAPAEDPEGPLAMTGGVVATTTILAALALLIAGGVLLTVRGRRNSEAQV